MAARRSETVEHLGQVQAMVAQPPEPKPVTVTRLLALPVCPVSAEQVPVKAMEIRQLVPSLDIIIQQLVQDLGITTQPLVQDLDMTIQLLAQDLGTTTQLQQGLVLMIALSQTRWIQGEKIDFIRSHCLIHSQS